MIRKNKGWVCDRIPISNRPDNEDIMAIIIIIIISLRMSFVGHKPSPGSSTAFYLGLLDATFFDADLSHLASGF